MKMHDFNKVSPRAFSKIVNFDYDLDKRNRVIDTQDGGVAYIAFYESDNTIDVFYLESVS